MSAFYHNGAGPPMAQRGPMFGRLATEELVTFRDLLLRLHGRA